MIYTALTIKAMQFAAKAHNGQMDKAGVPYIFHCYEVANQAKNEFEAVVGFLHDVIEDTDCSEEDLREADFPEVVVENVVCLTHKKEESYDEYLDRIKGHGGIATRVKLSDLYNNTRQERLSLLDEEETKEFLEKYRHALCKLNGVLTFEHQAMDV